jgi:hypothetical protein
MMAAHESLSAQFAAHQDERGFIHGQAARNIFRQANIRMWPERSAPHLGRSEGYIAYDLNMGGYAPKTTDVRPHETLHTSQQHLHGPTLTSLLASRDPEKEEHPVQVYESKRGHTWIEEGHHRLVASRLQGWSEEAEHGREH